MKGKVRLEDITYYSHTDNHPFSYSPKCSRSPTPNNAKNKNKNTGRGLMSQTIAERLYNYKKDQKEKAFHKTIGELKYESLEKERK